MAKRLFGATLATSCRMRALGVGSWERPWKRRRRGSTPDDIEDEDSDDEKNEP